jgi:predicted nucleic acid-binding protein
VTALVLDVGALIAIERGDRPVLAQLRVAASNGLALRTNAMVVSQVWRSTKGRQAKLSQLLAAVDVRSIDQAAGRAAGELVGKAGTADTIDATVALLADPGDRILTSDPDDLRRLAAAAGTVAIVVSC